MLTPCRLAFSIIVCLLVVATGKKQRCGIATIGEDRIVYGQVAKKGANPWIVSLEIYWDGDKTWQHKCAGTLLDKQTILTAAHCFKLTKDVTKWRIVAGQFERLVPECSKQILAVGAIIQHEGYAPHDHRDDIALVLADGKFRTGGTFVRPVCLPPKGAVFDDHTPCSIAGWGQSMFTVPEADRNKLLYYNSTILPRDECAQTAQRIAAEWDMKIGEISERMICIKSEYDDSKAKGTGGVCGDDSGGPLICKCGDSQCLAGVVSWSLRRPCGYTHDVFTRLQTYLDWIEKKRKFKLKSKKRPAMPVNC